MKNILLCLIYFLFLSDLHAQYDQKFSYQQLSKGVEIYNGISSVVHYPKGITFVNKEGKQYSKYFKGFNIFGSMECGLIVYKGKYFENMLPTNDKAHEFEVVPFIEVVKELESIDETYLDNYLIDFKNQKEYEINPSDFIEKFVSQFSLFGWARKGEKYAYITKFGELITDFKYERDQYGIFRIDANGNKKVYIEINASGEEIYKSEFPISYIIYNTSYKFYDFKTYHLNFNGFNYPLNNKSQLREAIDYRGYPKDCNTVTDGNTIFRLNKGNVKSKKLKEYYIVTNFYKNRAIAVKKSEISLSKQNLFIIDERGKIIKLIPKEFIETSYSFDNYGLIEVFSEDGMAVIDFNGNFIISPCSSCYITYLSSGLYGVFYLKDSMNLDLEKSGFYNQFGQKILPAEHSYYSPELRLREGKKYNYLMNGTSVNYILDKQNNVVKK